jgi:integrase
MAKTPKRTKNIIHLKDGKIEVSDHWPDGTRLRRRVPDEKTALDMLSAKDYEERHGDWRALRDKWNDKGKKAVEQSEKDISIAECAERYYNEWCVSRHKRPDQDEKIMKNTVRIIGDKRLQPFTRADGNYFYSTRLTEVATRGPRIGQKITIETANHDLTFLSGMLRWAHEEMGWIPANPLKDFDWEEPLEKIRYPVDGLQIRNLVGEAIEIDKVVGKCFGIVSETGLRIGHAIDLPRALFDVHKQQIVVPPFKGNKKGYQIPLSPWALELARDLPRIAGIDNLFVRQDTRVHSKKAWGKLEATYVRTVFEEARKRAGIQVYITPHDLRHFRAITWLEIGWDLDKVREWMGHKNIETTKRYLKYVKPRPVTFEEMQKREREQLDWLREQQGGEEAAQ